MVNENMGQKRRFRERSMLQRAKEVGQEARCSKTRARKGPCKSRVALKEKVKGRRSSREYIVALPKGPSTFQTAQLPVAKGFRVQGL
jgi:hypothetical protein